MVGVPPTALAHPTIEPNLVIFFGFNLPQIHGQYIFVARVLKGTLKHWFYKHSDKSVQCLVKVHVGCCYFHKFGSRYQFLPG